MKVYGATKFENTEVIRRAYELLRARGHTVTHDWTNESAEKLVGEERRQYLVQCAMKDYEGVMNCDAILIVNFERGCGMFTEFGIALAADKVIVVVDGDKPPHNIFFNLPNVHHFPTLEEAVAFICGYEQGSNEPLENHPEWSR